MKHITGIGGIFFKANDPEKLGEWDPEGNRIELWEPPPQCSGSPKNQAPKPKQT